MQKGYVQIYTGNGKGKTTAALGLGLRAVGRGMKVMVFQFVKGSFSGELESIKKLSPAMQIRRIVETEKFIGSLSAEEKGALKEKARRQFKEVEEFVLASRADVVILDEIMAAIHHGIIEVEDVCRLVAAKPEGVELILTGRNAPAPLMEQADLVTEMTPVKHYYQKGVPAREGIEK